MIRPTSKTAHGLPFLLVVLLFVGVALPSIAAAGTITTWTGGSPTNNNWSQATNWTTVPTTTGTFSLVYTGTPARTTSQNNIGVVKVDSILFSNNGTAGQDVSFRVNSTAGNSISLVSGATVTTTTASTGTLSDVFSSNLSLLGTGTFNVGANHNVTISGTLNAAGVLTKTGNGDLLLSGNSTLNGISIEQGLVQVNATSAAALNATAVSIGSSGNAGTLRYFGLNGTSTPSLTLRGNATVQANSNSNITFSSSTFNSADATVTSPLTLSLVGGSLGNAGTQTISGVIQDNSGAGTVGVTIGAASTTNVWVLAGNNTYTGDTTVAVGGKLLLDGSLSADTATTSSGYVGGSGTFAGDLTIASGTLAPGGTSSSGGVISDSIGTLTVDTLTLSTPATTAMTISGTSSYDQIVATGAGLLGYGGTLALTLSGSYADGTTFDLFSGFASPTGDLTAVTLDAIGEYAGLTFTGPSGGDWFSDWTAGNQQLKFSQATGQLSVVPEPSTIVFAAIGLAMFGWSTWTRRRAMSRRLLIEASIA